MSPLQKNASGLRGTTPFARDRGCEREEERGHWSPRIIMGEHRSTIAGIEGLLSNVGRLKGRNRTFWKVCFRPEADVNITIHLGSLKAHLFWGPLSERGSFV